MPTWRFWPSDFTCPAKCRVWDSVFSPSAAARLGVAGYVKNLFDGRVEVYAIGNAAQLEALKNELRRGPRMATVDHVTEAEAEVLPAYSNGFTIERDD